MSADDELTTTRSSGSRAPRPTTRSSAPTARWRGSTTPTATPTTRRRGAVQGGQHRVRDAARPRAPSPLRRLRRRRHARGGGPGPAAPATPFGFGDIFDAFFGGDPFGNGAARRARRARPTPRRWSTSTSRRPRSAPPRPSTSACPSRAQRCEGSGCEPGTHPGALRRVRRHRRGARGPALDPRPDRHRGAVRRVQRHRQPHPHSVQRVPRRRARALVAVDRRRGARRRRRRPAPAPRRSRPGRAARRRPRRPLRHRPRRAPTPRFERQGDDLVHVRTDRVHAGGARARASTIETLEGPEELIVPPGTQPGHVFRLKGRGVPALRGRGRGDLLVRVDVEVPTPARRPRKTSCCARSPTLRGEEVARGTTRACSPGSSPRSSSAPPIVTGRPVDRRPLAGVARPRTSTSTASTTASRIDGDDGHHLQRVRRRARGRDGHRRRRLRAVARVRGRAPRGRRASTSRRSRDVRRTSRRSMPRLTVACVAHEGREARARGAEAHRARRRPDRARARRRARSCTGTSDRAASTRSTGCARVAREAGDAVAPGAAPDGRRPGRARRAGVGRPGSWSPAPDGVAAAELPAPPGGEWVVAVGPEGGFDDDELQQLRRAPRVSAVGPFVLRAETAAIAAAAALAGRRAAFIPSRILTAESGDRASLSDSGRLDGIATAGRGLCWSDDGTVSTDVMSGSACGRSAARRGCRSTTSRRAPTRSSRRRCSAPTSGVSARISVPRLLRLAELYRVPPDQLLPAGATTLEIDLTEPIGSPATASPSTSCGCTRSTTPTPR